MRESAAWEQLEPKDLSNAQAPVAARSRHSTFSGALEPTATNSLSSGEAPSRPKTQSENYDRVGTMNRLVKDGKEAAKPICSGC